MDTIYFDDAPLPGYDHRLIVQEQIERKDASGETSAGTQNHQGWKPAILTITLKFKHEDTVGVGTLKGMWRQRLDDGTPAVWKITHDVADALDIWEVRFTDFLRVSPPEKAKRWDAVFNMIEVRPRTEAKEERAELAAEDTAVAPAGTVTATGETPASAEPETFIEKLLHKADALLGKILFGDSQ